MATATKQVIDCATANRVMRAIDQAAKASLAAMGLEAFRFDADVCIEEQWLRVKIRIRPTT